MVVDVTPRRRVEARIGEPDSPRVVLVCGARDWTQRETIRSWLSKLPPGSVIVHGAARGADTIADEEARALGFEVRPYPADWQKHGKAAGPIRNQRMLDAEAPDVVLAFTFIIEQGENDPGTITRGTGDMVYRALKAGIRCTIIPPMRLDAQRLLAPVEP